VNFLTPDGSVVDGGVADDCRSPLNVVWLAGLSPVGVTSGLAMYSSGLSEALAAAGNDVSGVGLGSFGDESSGAVRWTTVEGEPKSRGRALVSALPYIAARLDTVEHRKVIDRALTPDVDVVLLDHLMSSWCLTKVEDWRSRTGGFVVHVAHNHESRVRRQWASSTPVLSKEGVYLRFDAARIRRLERKVLGSVDLVTTITLDDRRTIAADVDFERSMVLTPGWSGGVVEDGPPFADRPRQVVLLGTFDWQAKRENLEAVVAALDSRFAEAGIGLLVIGSGDAAFLKRQRDRWVATEFLGYVEEPWTVLATCRLGVVAEPIGGGFKLKALDYGFSGLPMAVLDGSLAGLDFESGVDIVAAANLDELAENIIAVIDDTERLSSLAGSARSRLESRHDWADRGQQLAARLRSLRARQVASGSPPRQIGNLVAS